jgi:hypothetical protein
VSRDSSVGIAMGYGLDGRGSIPSRRKRFLPTQRPERLWGPPSFLSNGYRGLFPREQSVWHVKLNTHLQLMPRSKMVDLYLHSPCISGMIIFAIADLYVQKKIYVCNTWSRDSVVGIATGYGLDDRGVGVRVPVWSRIICSPRRPDRLWGSPSLLSNGYRR